MNRVRAIESLKPKPAMRAKTDLQPMFKVRAKLEVKPIWKLRMDPRTARGLCECEMCKPVSGRRAAAPVPTDPLVRRALELIETLGQPYRETGARIEMILRREFDAGSTDQTRQQVDQAIAEANGAWLRGARTRS